MEITPWTASVVTSVFGYSVTVKNGVFCQLGVTRKVNYDQRETDRDLLAGAVLVITGDAHIIGSTIMTSKGKHAAPKGELPRGSATSLSPTTRG